MSNKFFGIDPSTKTGVAVVDDWGKLIDCEMINSDLPINRDIERMNEIVCNVINWVHEKYEPGDLVCIESPSYGSTGNYVIQQGTIGLVMRIEMFKRGIKWVDAAPGQLKKFISGNHLAKKPELVKPLKELYGFTHYDDNVRDAFGLAQIAFSVRTGVWKDKKQGEVINKILSKEE